MEATNLNIRCDRAVKNEAESIFAELGLNMSTAVNMFLRSTIREHGIPFSLRLEKPNETTIAAIDEGRALLNDTSSPSYSTMTDLKAALGV